MQPMAFVSNKLASVDRSPKNGMGGFVYAPEGGTGHLIQAAPSIAASLSEVDSASIGGPLSGEHLGRQLKSSHKAHRLSEEITGLEQRCIWLENRNKWLSAKMISVQRSFITYALNLSSKYWREKCFKSWREGLVELRLEHQLEEQTRGLDQIQQVAHNLGACLADERKHRQEVEAETANVKDEISRVVASSDSIRRKIENQSQRIGKLEQIVHAAETALANKQVYSNHLAEEGNEYERRRKALEREAKESERQEKPEKKGYTVQESMKLLEGAQDVLHKAQTLLPSRTSPKGCSTPTKREDARAVPNSSSAHQIRSVSPQPSPKIRVRSVPVGGVAPATAPSALSLPVQPSQPSRPPRWSTTTLAPQAVQQPEWQQQFQQQHFQQQQQVVQYQATPEDLFNALDTNHDGVITRDEFRAMSQIAKADRCICGNVFMADALFCRKCGLKRPEVPASPSMAQRLLPAAGALSPTAAAKACGTVPQRASMMPSQAPVALGSPVASPSGSVNIAPMPRTPPVASRQLTPTPLWQGSAVQRVPSPQPISAVHPPQIIATTSIGPPMASTAPVSTGIASPMVGGAGAMEPSAGVSTSAPGDGVVIEQPWWVVRRSAGQVQRS